MASVLDALGPTVSTMPHTSLGPSDAENSPSYVINRSDVTADQDEQLTENVRWSYVFSKRELELTVDPEELKRRAYQSARNRHHIYTTTMLNNWLCQGRYNAVLHRTFTMEFTARNFEVSEAFRRQLRNKGYCVNFPTASAPCVVVVFHD